MLESTPMLAVGAMLLISVGHALWRRRRARDIAERWLAQHRYRVRSLRASFWDSPGRFRVTPFRNNDWAADFRAEVDDMRLGGTGTVRLRVWTDWLGMIDREPEISWVSMPKEENGGSQSPDTQWADAQLAVLRRVADGETTFRPEGREPAARRAFDDTVEHLLALQRRGLLTCSTPIAELKVGAQYAAVMDIELTDDGRRVLANASAAPRVTSTLSE
jgi:hypothetical protein